MDSRYTHPQVSALWSLPWTYDAWWRIEVEVARAQLAHDLIDDAEASPLLVTMRPNFDSERVLSDLAIAEVKTKHDVAAFVQFMRKWMGEPHGRWVHYGLTSSDLVDTAQGMRFRAMWPTVQAAGLELVNMTRGWTRDDTVVVGRTHGQAAEPTTVGIRAQHWAALIEPAVGHLIRDTRKMAVAKIAGPVGTYAHNPPVIEQKVATALKLTAQAGGASQIVPRGNLGRWANSAAELVHACAKIAIDLRLMNMMQEAREPHTDGQVGSSAMPHKNNPIRAEQIAGLARLAAGYASMLQPLDLWLERDISHSCVERVAVPDLWHVVLHAIEQTCEMLTRTQVSKAIASIRVEDEANGMHKAAVTLAAIRDGMDADTAREFAMGFDLETYDLEGDIRRDFLGNYPREQRADELP